VIELIMRGLYRSFHFTGLFSFIGFPLSGIDFEEPDADSRRVVADAGIVGDGFACFRGQERERECAR
jgi:hypothetical protein